MLLKIYEFYSFLKIFKNAHEREHRVLGVFYSTWNALNLEGKSLVLRVISRDLSRFLENKNARSSVQFIISLKTKAIFFCPLDKELGQILPRDQLYLINEFRDISCFSMFDAENTT